MNSSNRHDIVHIIAVFESTKRNNAVFVNSRWQSVRNAQLQLISDDSTHYKNFPLDGYELTTVDYTHFTSNALINIGNNVANIIINNL